MKWLAVLEILKTIGGAAGAIITLTALWGLISKKPKEWIKKIAREVVQEEQENLKNHLEEQYKASSESLAENIQDLKQVLGDIRNQLEV